MSPNIDTKLEKLQVKLVKKNSKQSLQVCTLAKLGDLASDNKSTAATPEIGLGNVMNSDIQSLSTLASTNKLSKCSDEIEMVFEDETMEKMAKASLFKSSKGTHSKERKLSNGEGVMLPPQAKNGDLLRPSLFKKSNEKPSKSGDMNQQALKPKTILGFLEESCSDCLLEMPRKEELEKAGTSLPTLSLISGTKSKAGNDIPAFTLG